MNIKNYTSNVHIDVTIARIERSLLDAGATAIAKEYEGKMPVALMFQIPFRKDQHPVTIKLPANVQACWDAFWVDHCKYRTSKSRKTKEDFREQASKTAWKLQQDWVEVQVSLIRLGQQEPMQAFLPYAWDGTHTVYQRIKVDGFQNLLPPAKEHP